MHIHYLWVLAVVPLLTYCAGTSLEPNTHPCERKCEENGKPMTCVYNLTLEWYYTMSTACKKCPLTLEDCSLPGCIAADGGARAVVVVNRQLPAPPIIVCENDEVVAHVHNKLGIETTTLHWHGVHHTQGTAHMDGVPMVTQCPIMPHSNFEYRFKANPAGTFFYHSHSGTQRMDGLAGALIVRQTAAADPHSALYDHDLPEHTLLMQEWLRNTAGVRFTFYHNDPKGEDYPRNIIINGKGSYIGFTLPNASKTMYTPREVFKVTQGQRYRFRVINAGSISCPLLVSIDDHTLLVIASDGQSMDPFEVDSLIVYAGERFDFVLTANQTAGNYWLKVKGDGDCAEKTARQAAILRYNESSETDPPGGTEYQDMDRAGVMLNSVNTPSTNTSVLIAEMNSTASDDDTSKPEADVIYYIGFKEISNYDFNGPHSSSPIPKRYLWNNISLLLPSSPLLYQYHDTPQDMFCKDENTQNCNENYCECVHVLRVRPGQVVELVVVSEFAADSDEHDEAHPMHLHGYKFRVVAQEKIGENISVDFVKQMDKAGKIKRKLSHAVLKDTVIVPPLGYTALRFIANNPGMWLFHCHLEFHTEIGMALLVQVDEPEKFPDVPTEFPRCGDYPSNVPQRSTPPPKREECTIVVVNGSSMLPKPTISFLLMFAIIKGLMLGH